MTVKIEVERNSSRKPVAWRAKDSDSIYWPGKDGACLSVADGVKNPHDYSSVNFAELSNYEPLYAGDVIRIVREIVL